MSSDSTPASVTEATGSPPAAPPTLVSRLRAKAKYTDAFFDNGSLGDLYREAAAALEVQGSCETTEPGPDGWSEWVHPLPGYRMQCCDCGLIHDMEFVVTQRDAEANTGPLNEGEDEDHVIIFRAKRADGSLESQGKPETKSTVRAKRSFGGWK